MGRPALDLESAVSTGGAGRLAKATGYTVAQVEEYVATWRTRRRLAEEYAIEMLLRLKAVLGPIGWERFRAYLLEVKAPFMVTITPEVDDETTVRPGSRSPVYVRPREASERRMATRRAPAGSPLFESRRSRRARPDRSTVQSLLGPQLLDQLDHQGLRLTPAEDRLAVWPTVIRLTGIGVDLATASASGLEVGTSLRQPTNPILIAFNHGEHQ
jgi:hypothetical protein